MRLTVLAALLLLTARPVEAGDASFPTTSMVDGGELSLRGIGRLSRWFITGCDIALYLPGRVDAGDALDDVAKRLHFHYYRNITAAQFGTGAMQTLEKAFSIEQLDAVRERIGRLHAAYRDVGAGDEYTLTYVPGRGTTLKLNGDGLITIPGADFARIYFAVWLGDPPLDERLKRELLKQIEGENGEALAYSRSHDAR